jgi:hypothetical protein
MFPWISWQTALILVILLLPFNLWLFPARTKRLKALSGYASPVIDTWFGYTPEKVFGVIDALKAEGRRLYAITQVTLDLLYPLVYNGLLAVLLGLSVPAAFPGTWLAEWLPRLPLLSLLSDYSENICIVILLLGYPRQPAALARLASAITVIKFCLIAAGLLGVLVSGGIWIFSQIRI